MDEQLTRAIERLILGVVLAVMGIFFLLIWWLA